MAMMMKICRKRIISRAWSRERRAAIPAAGAHLIQCGFDAEPSQLGNQSRSGDSQASRGSMPSPDHSFGLLQSLKNVIPRSILKRLAFPGGVIFLAPQLAGGRLKRGTFGNNHAALHKILEFTDIARPI